MRLHFAFLFLRYQNDTDEGTHRFELPVLRALIYLRHSLRAQLGNCPVSVYELLLRLPGTAAEF